MCLAFVLISVVPLPNPCLSSFSLTGEESAERNESQAQKEKKRKRRKAAGEGKVRENKWTKGATIQKESTFYSLFRKYFQIVFELQTMLATVIWNSLNLFECIWRIFSHSSPNLCVFLFYFLVHLAILLQFSLHLWRFWSASVAVSWPSSSSELGLLGASSVVLSPLDLVFDLDPVIPAAARRPSLHLPWHPRAIRDLRDRRPGSRPRPPPPRPPRRPCTSTSPS